MQYAVEMPQIQVLKMETTFTSITIKGILPGKEVSQAASIPASGESIPKKRNQQSADMEGRRLGGKELEAEKNSSSQLATQAPTGSLNLSITPLPSIEAALAPPAPDGHKRAKLRLRTATAPKPSLVDLCPPDQPPPGKTNLFNVSEVIKGFLYVGAGYDPSNRVVTNLPNDNADPSLRIERLGWFQQNNVRYALNMAGSPLQKELSGVTYPLGDLVKNLALDVNDIEDFTESMAEQFDKGAAFIQEAFCEYQKHKHEAASVGAPPSMFVHCVAGVNRSPFVIVWWLCKHHQVAPETAWELVRRRRDAGVNWTNQTLGGPVVVTDATATVNTTEQQPPVVFKKRKWFEDLKRRFSKV